MVDFFSVLSASERDALAQIEAVATDIDGTLTTGGVLSPEVVLALSKLRKQGLRVCLVTGRSSGWVQGLVSYLPVSAAIAENGGVIFLGRESAPYVRNSETGAFSLFESQDFRMELREMFERLKFTRPSLRETEDNLYRLSDFTFHVTGLSQADLKVMKDEVEACDLAFTWSTIHAHIMPQGQQKGTALEWLLAHWGLACMPANTTLTVGDSPNDATLFCPEKFPISAGVANITNYQNVMDFYPKNIATLTEGDGFVEIVQSLLQLKSESA